MTGVQTCALPIYFCGKASRLGGKQHILQGCTDADPLLVRRDVTMIILDGRNNGLPHWTVQRPRACRLDHRIRCIGVGSVGGLREKVCQGIAFVIWDVDQPKAAKTAMIRRCGCG